MLTIFASTAILFTALSASAAPSHVIIREIQVSGSSTTDEFVELYNPTSAPINLEGWRLSRRTASGHETNLLSVFPSITLAPGQYFLVAHPTGYAGTVASDAIYSTAESLASNNTVVLYSDAGATIVDMVGFGTASSFEGASAPNPASGQSVERRLDSESLIIDTDNNAADFATLITPTPTNSTSTVSPILPAPPPPTNQPPNSPNQSSGGGNTEPTLAISGEVLINEFVADPSDGEEEWIELINRSGRTIDLSGWTIEEGSGSATALSGTILGASPYNFFVLTKPKGNLNNSGDRIILKSTTGLVIDAVSYGSWDDGNRADNAPTASDPRSVARSHDGLASGRDAADFVVADTPTRGLTNVVTSPLSNATTTVSAATLRLSELLPNPPGSDADEYIEIENIGTTNVNLVGWRLADNTDDYIVSEGDLPDLIVHPGAYLILPRRVTKLALNNSGGETVRLFPPESETAVAEVSYNGTTPEGAAYVSSSGHWEWTNTPTPGAANILSTANLPPILVVDIPGYGKVGEAIVFSAEDTTDPDGDALTIGWLFGDNETATGDVVRHVFTQAGSFEVTATVDDGSGGKVSATRTLAIAPATITPAVLGATAAAARLILNELLPAPEKGQTEWIEIHNLEKQTIALDGWRIEDASGRKFIFPAAASLAAGGYLQLSKSTTHISLNNDGDTIILLAPNGETVDETEYGSAATGEAWARQGNDWEWTMTPTPAARNIDTPIEATAEDSNKTSSSNIRRTATITGIVSAAPGMVAVNRLYLTDVTGTTDKGLRVDLPKGIKIDISVGSRVRVTGTLGSIQTEPRLTVRNANSLTILNHTGPAPIVSNQADVEIDNPENIGQLIRAEGEIERRTSTGFTLVLADDSTLRIVAPSAKNARYPVGTALEVIGVLSRTNAGPRLLIRTPNDIIPIVQPLASGPAPTTPPTNQLPYVFATAAGLIALTAASLYRWWTSRTALLPAGMVIEDEDTV